MDIYYPPERNSNVPAVVFVSGYSDFGFQKMLGCKLKEMGLYISWGQLTAVSGMAAITYSAVEPAADVHTLVRYVRANAESLGIDENKIGVWACSGSVPNALALLMGTPGDYLKCAVLCYGIMMDLEGSTSTAESAKAFGFVNPGAGKSVDDLPRDMPLFVVRDGQDEIPHLNKTLDRFLAKALSLNLPLTITNHSTAPHAFDLMHDSETSREIIKQILAFLRFHLLA
jgi:acetyl esterase/lipase